MSLWEKVKKDMQKTIRESQKGIREGLTAVKKKTGVLTEEGKRRYKLFDLKSKVQKEMAELGGRVYSLEGKNPMPDAKVKAIMAKVKKLEAQIEKLEGKPKKARKKKIARAKT